MNPNTFPCPSCGGPVDPLPGKTHLPCPFCGSAVTIPEELRLAGSSIETPGRTSTKPYFVPPPPRTSDDITDVLRQVEPFATNAVKGYGLWVLIRSFFRRILPACAIVLLIFCILACVAAALFLFLARRGG